MGQRWKSLLRMTVIGFLDLLLIAACGILALLVRFGLRFSDIPQEQFRTLLMFISLQAIVTLCVFPLRKMYHYIWRTVSAHDVLDMIVSVVLSFFLTCVVAAVFHVRMPVSVTFVMLLCQMVTMVGIRCALRFYNMIFRSVTQRGTELERVMLIGAGEAGRVLLNEIASSDQIAGKVCCIIDDNPGKWGKQMDGVPIVGGREQIREQAKKHKITQIIFAIPTARSSDKCDILNRCKVTGCRIKTLPGIYQMVNGTVNLAAVKDVQIEDLLGRETVTLGTDALNSFLSGKVVMVTGGGGSIGSELCRQIAEHRPKQLIILDIYENNAYDLQQELLRVFPQLNLQVMIGSVRDKQRTYEIFDACRPQVVFHAAAHKHVPLMEACPEEAVKNNIFGTYHVVRAAEKFGVEKFVMISTDKAVNPTNVMGATKRFCEMILQSRKNGSTRFCAVRFGNVLGSNGSVVPLFKRQIESGGPVTLTDKRIIRYFMTIPEAAQLVLEAGAMAKPGQIFVLDMGEPVKILTLAENLIRLSGLEPYKDIEIEEIGLRPGEKLFEELLMDSESLTKTANEKIFVEQQESIDPEQIMDGLVRLDQAVTANVSPEELTALLKQLVPTFRSPEEVNQKTEQKQEVPERELSYTGVSKL